MHVDTKPVEAETKMSSMPDLAIARLLAAQLHTWWSVHGERATLKGSFSAVSKPFFANKNSLESSRRNLHNALYFTTLQSHKFVEHDLSKFPNL